MNNVKKLISICNAYKAGEFDIQEFQNRLETVYLPIELKNTLEKDLYNAFNKLEEIRFSLDESHQKQYAGKIADDLIHSAQNY